MRDFKKIRAWHRAHALSIALHKLVRGFSRKGNSRLQAQLTNAADLATQIVGRQVQAGKNAQAAGAGHRSDEVRSGDAAHARLKDWMAHVQQLAKR